MDREKGRREKKGRQLAQGPRKIDATASKYETITRSGDSVHNKPGDNDSSKNDSESDNLEEDRRVL